MSKFQLGDKVVVPFYTACGDCYYCVRGQASRCSKGELFGNSAPANTIDGGQAEYVRTPLADTTLVKAPTDIPEEMLVCGSMGDRWRWQSGSCTAVRDAFLYLATPQTS